MFVWSHDLEFFYIFAIYFAPGIDNDRADTCYASILCSLSMKAGAKPSRAKGKKWKWNLRKWFSSQIQFSLSEKKVEKFIRSEGSFISSDFSWLHLNILLL